MKLEEIEKICDAATPGPWMGFIPAADEPVLKAVLSGMEQYADKQFGLQFGVKDAGFIAASRTLMPKLLAVAKAAKLVSQGMHDEDYFVMGWEILEKALKELEKLPEK